MRFGRLDASFHVSQEWRAPRRSLVRTSFQPFKDNVKVHEEPLPFGQSYWGYLPDLVQNKIMKMVHNPLLKQVNAELLRKCYCLNCGTKFKNPFKMEEHRLDSACDCECEFEWDDWWESERCIKCGR